MFLTQPASKLYDSALALVYPQACVICGLSVESRVHEPACAACWKETRTFVNNEAMCWKCGVPARHSSLNTNAEAIRCRKCDSLEFTAARACGMYEGGLRASVLQLKRQPRLSAGLTTLLGSTAQRSPLNNATLIVPVPLHSERERRRGFNQATIIAQALSIGLSLPLDEQVLVRSVASEKYRAGLDAKGRSDTVANAFNVRVPRRIEGEEILLVDDVFTTGATASSCAAVLRAAGARSVFVLTIARPE